MCFFILRVLAAAVIEAIFLFQAGNALTKELLRRLTHSRKIFLIPVNIHNKHIIRFTVTSQFTTADDIHRDWGIISEMAAALLAETRAPNGARHPECGKDAPSAGQEKTDSAARCNYDDAAKLEKGEMELWIDKAQKPVRALGCDSEPLPCTYFETKNGHECEGKPRVNGSAAEPAAVPKAGVKNTVAAMGKNIL